VNEFLVDIGIYDGGLPPSLSTPNTVTVCRRVVELDKQLFYIETAGLTMCTCLSGRNIVFYLEADGEAAFKRQLPDAMENIRKCLYKCRKERLQSYSTSVYWFWTSDDGTSTNVHATVLVFDRISHRQWFYDPAHPCCQIPPRRSYLMACGQHCGPRSDFTKWMATTTLALNYTPHVVSLQGMSLQSMVDDCDPAVSDFSVDGAPMGCCTSLSLLVHALVLRFGVREPYPFTGLSHHRWRPVCDLGAAAVGR
jgi:hypothetical protein